ncbi:uncharacterized protein LOC108241975 [Kryptolebias marmoratus]|uniref:uncharacterized protein LOC108241975 n=1 Tax=Kryptolebias marmoratus TaxID=37003 RepID=UPI0007F907F7|nr:uncharacterized protein LOC108241975 [Kryptolebias marmoratus]
MQMLKVAELTLLLILVSYSKGESWTIKVDQTFNVTKGSNITILCTFTYPSGHKVQNVYWKTVGKRECNEDDIDKNAFVFHPNNSCVLQMYREKTKLIGDIAKENCSLLIKDIQETKEIYMRLFTDKNKYSFRQHCVSISVKGLPKESPKPDLSSYTTASFETSSIPSSSSDRNNNIYLAIFIPLVALVVVAVVGIIAYTKHKRSHKLTRKESGHYVNFSRTASNPPKSETSCKTTNPKLPEEKVIDEAIYINVQAPPNQRGQDMEHTESIYANMDYST